MDENSLIDLLEELAEGFGVKIRHEAMEPHGLSPWYLHKNTLRSAPAFAKPATAGVGRSVRKHQGFGGLSASGEIRRSSDTSAQD